MIKRSIILALIIGFVAYMAIALFIEENSTMKGEVEAVFDDSSCAYTTLSIEGADVGRNLLKLELRSKATREIDFILVQAVFQADTLLFKSYGISPDKRSLRRITIPNAENIKTINITPVLANGNDEYVCYKHTLTYDVQTKISTKEELPSRSLDSKNIIDVTALPESDTYNDVSKVVPNLGAEDASIPKKIEPEDGPETQNETEVQGNEEDETDMSVALQAFTPEVRFYRTIPSGVQVPMIEAIADWRTCYPNDTFWTPREGCPDYPDGWSVDDVIYLLKAFPNRYFDLGTWNNRPPGDKNWLRMGDLVNMLQERMTVEGLAFRRILVSHRPDVLMKRRENFHLCDPYCEWSGRMDGTKGDTEFDTDWIMRVPTALHDKVVHEFLDDVDPFDTSDERANRAWPEWIDKEEVLSLNTPSEKVALYGTVRENGTFTIAALVMDLREPELREWTAKKFLYQLEDMGVDPGEAFGMRFAYKPGFHVYHDNVDAYNNPCYQDEFLDGTPIHTWFGPASVCWGTGPMNMHPTQYGPGEFEDAINKYTLKLFSVLESGGYDTFDILTNESPPYKDEWSILSPEVINSEHMIGEWRQEIIDVPESY